MCFLHPYTFLQWLIKASNNNKTIGEKREATAKKLMQLHQWYIFQKVWKKEWTWEEKATSFYVWNSKEKWNKIVKGWACGNRQSQREYIPKEDAAVLMMSIKWMFIMSVIEAKEKMWLQQTYPEFSFMLKMTRRWHWSLKVGQRVCWWLHQKYDAKYLNTALDANLQ